MRSWGKTPHFLVALNCFCVSHVYADEAPAATAKPSEASSSATASSADAARDALKQKASDSNSEKDLEKVFQSAEKITPY